MCRPPGENDRIVEEARGEGGTGRSHGIPCLHTGILAIDDLAGTLDFAIAIAVVHEAPDARRFLAGIFDALKKGGSLLFSEPAGHVSGDEFNGSLSLARAVGFEIHGARKIFRSHSALLSK